VERHIKKLREEREKSGTTLTLETALKIRRERSAPEALEALLPWNVKLRLRTSPVQHGSVEAHA
jgi:hypothetical protein